GRWGGAIIACHPGETETCVDVVGLPLDSRARPVWTDATLGRFRACAPGFYDPEVYAEGRSVTVVGTVAETERVEVDKYELEVPRVAAEVLYIWPDRPAYPYYAYPYWGWGWGPGWGWGWGPGWGWGWPYWGYGWPGWR